MRVKENDFFRCREFQPLDHYFAEHMLALAFGKGESPSAAIAESLYLASGLLCYEAARGNVCVNLQEYAATEMKATRGEGGEVLLRFPNIAEWLPRLRATRVVGGPGADTPLVLEEAGDSARLYLYRYWQYEQNLADWIKARLEQPVVVDELLLQEGLARLFPGRPGAGTDPDYQRVAAENAVRRRFSVISGGPGTGKTTIVLSLLVLLLDQARDKRFHVELAAPTGKAAARLKESLRAGKKILLDRGAISRDVFERIREEASTLHRLLGAIDNSVYFRHNKELPLSLDCLIVDEASMVDLAMMSKLAAAMPADSRLVLLGDMDQLSSVEAGSVFGDICAGHRLPATPLGRSVVRLQRSYRFDARQGIGGLSSLINAGRAEEAWNFVYESGDPRVKWVALPPGPELRRRIRAHLQEPYRQYLAAADIKEAFARLKKFAILCALRNGPYGAKKINGMIENILIEENLIPRDEPWYTGRPVMITRNDYQLGLFNGDIGIVFEDPADGRRKVFFETADTGRFRGVAPGRLPEHESVFAMTVHKSQGSEFDRVLLLLPDSESEILTRELIYTGLTRGRHHVEIWGMKHIFLQAIRKQCRRNSGLTEKLLKANDGSHCKAENSTR